MLMDPRPRAGRALILTLFFVIVTIVAILFFSAMRWAVGARYLFTQTATPTATPHQAPAATADFRATRVSEDAAAVATYNAEIGYATPAVELTLRALDVFVPLVAQGEEGTSTAEAVAQLPDATTEAQPSSQPDVMLPIVSGQDGSGTPSSPLPEPTTTPPADTHLPIVVDSPLETPTPTLPPTPTPTLSPTPTAGSPTPFFVADSMRAVVRSSDAQRALAYAGPASIFTNTLTLNNGDQLILTARTTSGEWVYGRYDNSNDFFWVRQAHARPAGNDYSDVLPTEEPPNDVRWLPTRIAAVAPPPSRTPVMTPTPLPADDYPTYRRDPANQAWVAALPQFPVQQSWNPIVAGQPLLSPLTVSGSNIVVSSSDNHIYFLGREAGNQRNRVLIDGVSRLAAAHADGSVYLFDINGRLLKLTSANDGIQDSLQLAQPSPNAGGINLIGDYLLVSAVGANSGSGRLYLVDRNDLTLLAEKAIAGADIQYPAVGDQLVYVGGSTVYALDPYSNLAEIWTYDVGARLSAPPVYIRPGFYAAAELYLADESGRITILDANTGLREAEFALGGQQITGLAVDDERLYIAGQGFLRAMRRDNAQNAWPNVNGVPLNADVLAGPFVGANEVLVQMEDGAIRTFDKFTGASLSNFIVNSRLAAPGIVAGPWIYLPGADTRLYGVRGAP